MISVVHNLKIGEYRVNQIYLYQSLNRRTSKFFNFHYFINLMEICWTNNQNRKDEDYF